jgi:hypothetical protein
VFDTDDSSEVVNQIGLGSEAIENFGVENRVVDIVETRISQEVAHLDNRAGIENENLVSAFDKGIGKMGSEKTGTAGNEHTH